VLGLVGDTARLFERNCPLAMTIRITQANSLHHWGLRLMLIDTVLLFESF
jgi:hypothetical protein